LGFVEARGQKNFCKPLRCAKKGKGGLSGGVREKALVNLKQQEKRKEGEGQPVGGVSRKNTKAGEWFPGERGGEGRGGQNENGWRLMKKGGGGSRRNKSAWGMITRDAGEKGGSCIDEKGQFMA